jgi:hypothetical protein
MAQQYLDQQLLFPQNPMVLESVAGIKNHRHVAQTKGPYAANSEIIFEWTHSQLMDAKNSFLSFDLTYDASGANIVNAVDVFERVKFEINSTLVDEFNRNAGEWNNVLMAFSANDSYAVREADALLGYASPHIANKAGNTSSDSGYISTTARNFVVPISFLLGVFRTGNYLPIMNQRYRLTLTLASDTKVVSHSVKETASYALNNIYLHERRVELTPKYWDAMWRAMNSNEGVRIAFTGLDPQVYAPDGSTTERQRITHNFANVASLFIIRNNKSEKTRDASEHTAHNQSFPLADLTKFQVKINGVNVHPDEGLVGFAQNYVETKKCFGQISDLGGEGLIDFNSYKSDYTKNTSLIDGTYGMCVLSADFEKVVANDDSVLNSGISAEDGNIIEYEITLSSALSSSNDELLTALAYKKAMVMRRGEIMVVY